MSEAIRLLPSPSRSERGQSLVEFAVTLPLLLLLVLGTVDLGMGFRTYITVTNMAREGARYLSIYPDQIGGAQQRINGEVARNRFLDPDRVSVPSPEFALLNGMPTVTVRVAYSYELLFGSLTGLPTIPFTAQATMVVLYDE